MPDRRLSRRTVVATAALVPGAAALTGCKDDPAAGSGTPGAVNGNPSTAGEPGEQTPTVDPAVVAALSSAATSVTQLSQLCATVSRKFPALRASLAAAAKHHASHLAKLKETPGVTAKAGTVAVPATSETAIFTISQREKAAAVAAAAAAAKLSGAPARLLAEIAACETQLSLKLAPRKSPTTSKTPSKKATS